MGDIVKGVLGGAWTLIVGWFLPCGVVLSVFGVLVLPSLGGLPILREVHQSSTAGKATVLLASAVVLGIILAGAQTPLYRILEGYILWPNWASEARKRWHVGRRRELYKEIRAAARSGADLSAKQQLRVETYLRYPAKESQVLATMFGNNIRRLEYYGQDRYNLDSQRLWFQLRAVVPDLLVKELDNAKATVNFFVCLIYMSTALTIVAGVTAATERSAWLRLALTSGLAAIAAVLSYRGATLATDSWAGAVRALVDLGRAPLAKANGMDLPKKLEAEREMWQALNWFAMGPYNAMAAALLDKWRSEPGIQAPKPTPESP